MQPQEDEAATAAGRPQASDASADAANTARRDGGHAGDSAEPHGVAGSDRAAHREGASDARAVEGPSAAAIAFARAGLAPLSAEDAAARASLRDERALNELVETPARATNLEEARGVRAAALDGTRS